jgi:hypothetical protein
MTSHLRVFVLSLVQEVELQSELNQARITEGRDLTKLCACPGRVHGQEVRMIEDIEGLSPELEADVLVDLDVLCEADIPRP